MLQREVAYDGIALGHTTVTGVRPAWVIGHEVDGRTGTFHSSSYMYALELELEEFGEEASG